MMITLPNYLSTRTYNENLNKSISYIIDESKHIHYILKGELSNLWNIIVKTQNYKQLLNYANINKIQCNISDFLNELAYFNIIKIKNIKKINNVNFLTQHILENSPNFGVYNNYKSKSIISFNKLEHLYMQLTYNCNLNCKHCYNPKNMQNFYISFNNAKKIIDETANLGVNTITLSGGECSVNQDFFNIAKYIRNRYISLRILTNGQIFYDDSNLLNHIINLYPHEVKISLYSMDPKIHDYITGIKNSHLKTIHVINKLRENNINVTINNILLKINYDKNEDVKNYAQSIGASYFLSSNRFIKNINNNNSQIRLTPKKLEKLYEQLPHIRIEKTYKSNDIVCPAGNTILNVMPNLNITPCIDFNYILGNFNENSLNQIWNEVLPDFRKKFIKSNLKECFKYDYCSYCKYCPTFSMFEQKNGFLKKSKMCCEDAKAYKKALEND